MEQMFYNIQEECSTTRCNISQQFTGSETRNTSIAAFTCFAVMV